jgi:SnoaL-like protein
LATLAQTELDVLLAKQAIREVLQNYCRSIDRLDRELMESVWHPDATILYEAVPQGSFGGTREEVVDLFMKVHDQFSSHSHQITNTTIAVDGDTAVSETYVTVKMQVLPNEEGRVIDLVVLGRYLDRWSKRDGRWAIDNRYYVSDVVSEYEVLSEFCGPDRADTSASRRDRQDPAYALFESAGASFGL